MEEIKEEDKVEEVKEEITLPHDPSYENVCDSCQ